MAKNNVTLKWTSNLDAIKQDVEKLKAQFNDLGGDDDGNISNLISQFERLRKEMKGMLSDAKKIATETKQVVETTEKALKSQLGVASSRSNTRALTKAYGQYSTSANADQTIVALIERRIEKALQSGKSKTRSGALDNVMKSLLDDSVSGVHVRQKPAKKVLGGIIDSSGNVSLQETYKLLQAIREELTDNVEALKELNQFSTRASKEITNVAGNTEKSKKIIKSSTKKVVDDIQDIQIALTSGLNLANRELQTTGKVGNKTKKALTTWQSSLVNLVESINKDLDNTTKKLTTKERRDLTRVRQSAQRLIERSSAALGTDGFTGTFARDERNLRFERDRRLGQTRVQQAALEMRNTLDATRTGMKTVGVGIYAQNQEALSKGLSAAQYARDRVYRRLSLLNTMGYGPGTKQYQQAQILAQEADSNVRSFSEQYRQMGINYDNATTTGRIGSRGNYNINRASLLLGSLRDLDNEISAKQRGGVVLTSTELSGRDNQLTYLSKTKTNLLSDINSGRLNEEQANEARKLYAELEALESAHGKKMADIRARNNTNLEREDKKAKKKSKIEWEQLQRTRQENEFRSALQEYKKYKDPSKLTDLELESGRARVMALKSVLNPLFSSRRRRTPEDEDMRQRLFTEAGITDPVGFMSSFNAVGKRLTGEQVSRSHGNVFQQFLASAFGVNTSTSGSASRAYGRFNNSMFNHMNKMTTRVGGLAGMTIYGMGTVGAGVAVGKQTVDIAVQAENMKNTLAGMINQYAEFSDANGLLIQGQEKFNRSLDYSAKVYEDIRKKAVQSILTTQELFDYVLAGAPQLLRSGLTMDQTTGIIDKVASLGKAMGLQPTAVMSDIRDLATGQVTVRSQVLRAMGFDSGKLATAQQGGPQTLMAYFNEVFKGFEPSFERLKELNMNKLSAFMDRLQRVSIQIGDKVLPHLTSGLERLSKFLEDPKTIANIDKFAGSFGSLIGGLTHSLSGFLEAASPIVNNIGMLLTVTLLGMFTKFTVGMQLEALKLRAATDTAFAGSLGKVTVGIGILGTLLAGLAYRLNQLGMDSMAFANDSVNKSKDAIAKGFSGSDQVAYAKTGKFILTNGASGLRTIAKNAYAEQSKVDILQSVLLTATEQSRGSDPGLFHQNVREGLSQYPELYAEFLSMAPERKGLQKDFDWIKGVRPEQKALNTMLERYSGSQGLSTRIVDDSFNAVRSILAANGRNLSVGNVPEGVATLNKKAALIQGVLKDSTIDPLVRKQIRVLINNLAEKYQTGDLENINFMASSDLENAARIKSLRSSMYASRTQQSIIDRVISRTPDSLYKGRMLTGSFAEQMRQATLTRDIGLIENQGDISKIAEINNEYAMSVQNLRYAYEDQLRTLRESIIQQKEELAIRKANNDVLEKENQINKKLAELDFLGGEESKFGTTLFGRRMSLLGQQAGLAVDKMNLENRSIDSQINAELRRMDPLEKVMGFFGDIMQDGFPPVDLSTDAKNYADKMVSGIVDAGMSMATSASIIASSVGSLAQVLSVANTAPEYTGDGLFNGHTFRYTKPNIRSPYSGNDARFNNIANNYLGLAEGHGLVREPHSWTKYGINNMTRGMTWLRDKGHEFTKNYLSGMSVATANQVYYDQYWNSPAGPGLPAPASIKNDALATVLFDTAVNPVTGIWPGIKSIMNSKLSDQEKAKEIIAYRREYYKKHATNKAMKGGGGDTRLDKLSRFIGINPVLTRGNTTSANSAVALLNQGKVTNSLNAEAEKARIQEQRLQSSLRLMTGMNASRIGNFEYISGLNRGFLGKSPTEALSQQFLYNATLATQFLGDQRGYTFDYANKLQASTLAGIEGRFSGNANLGKIRNALISAGTTGRAGNLDFNALGITSRADRYALNDAILKMKAAYEATTTSQLAYQNSLDRVTKIQSRIAIVLEEAQFQFDQRMRKLDALRGYRRATYGEYGSNRNSIELRARGQYIEELFGIEVGNRTRNLSEMNGALALLRDSELSGLTGPMDSLIQASSSDKDFRKYIANMLGIPVDSAEMNAIMSGASKDQVMSMLSKTYPNANMGSLDSAIGLAGIGQGRFSSVFKSLKGGNRIEVLTQLIEGIISETEGMKEFAAKMRKELEAQATLLERKTDLERELVDLDISQRERYAERDYNRLLDQVFSDQYKLTDANDILRMQVDDQMSAFEDSLKVEKTNSLLEYIKIATENTANILSAIASANPAVKDTLTTSGLLSSSGDFVGLDASIGEGSAAQSLLRKIEDPNYKLSVNDLTSAGISPQVALSLLPEFERRLTMNQSMSRIDNFRGSMGYLRNTIRPQVLQNNRNKMLQDFGGSLFNSFVGNPFGMIGSGAGFVGGIYDAASPFLSNNQSLNSMRSAMVYSTFTGGLTASQINDISLSGLGYGRTPSRQQLALMSMPVTPWTAGIRSSAQRRFGRTQLGYMGMDMAGSLTGNYLGRLIGGDSRSVSMGGELGGILGSTGAIFGGLGAWAGPVGMVAGSLLGGLFGRRRRQADPREEQHKRRVEDLLSGIDHKLKPVGDYYNSIKGTALFGQSSRYMSGRYRQSIGLQGSFGGRF